MKSWPKFKDSGLLNVACENLEEKKYWTKIFEQMHQDPQVLDTWDYQWLYACWSHNGLSITPNQNLISNLGFNRQDAAHTIKDDPRSKLMTSDIWEISHPLFLVRNREADKKTYECLFHDNLFKKLGRRLFLLKRILENKNN